MSHGDATNGTDDGTPGNGWLAFGRSETESFLIGDDIEVKVIRAERGWCRLAIRAPRHVSIDRSEVRVAKLRDGRLRDDHRDRAEPGAAKP